VLGAPIRYDFYAENPTFLEFLEEEESAIETAIAFLRRVLSKGEIPSNELLAQAKKEGIKDRTYWRARKRLGVKAKWVYVDGKQIWVAYLPNQANQSDQQPHSLPNSDTQVAQPEPTGNPTNEPDPQGSPPDRPAGDGSLPNNPADITNFGSLGSVGEKPKQNLEFCSLPTEKAFGSLGSVGREPASVAVCQVCQTQNDWQTALADYKSPINKGISEQVCQVCQTSGNLEGDLQGSPPANDLPDDGSPTLPDQPEGDPQEAQPETDRQGSPPSACGNLIYSNKLGLPDDSPEPDQQPTDPLWLVFDGVLPELVVDQPRPDSPEPEVSPPDLPANEPDRPEGSPLEDQPTEEIPPDQPVATLNEPTCPICRIELEPEPDSGLAACLGCGRLFKVEIPPTSPEGDDSDDNPPISPDGDGGNPPNPQGNGHGGSQTGFAPPKTLSIPPVFPSANRIYSNKFNSPAILNRMTKRLPDGSIKLVWDDKTETVTPADLAGWQHIEEIPEVDLQDIESVEIPPVVVLDLETKGKDPQHGHILAVGLALFVAGKEVETQIFHNEGDEAALLFQVFDYLRETCDSLGDFILTGYNMFDFDLRFLIERSRRLRMKRACPFDYERDENGNIKRLPIPDTHGKYKYTAIKTTLPIMLIDTQHLVIRWDEFERVLTDYSLKSVAEHFGVNIPNRPKPTPEQIVHAFYHNRPLFDAYLLADLRETYAVFDILIEPYLGIAAFTGLDLEDLARKNGRGWVWEQHYERHYTEIPEADKTRKYKGGLVVCRKGLWFNCAKFDIASLYPTIALAYRIHSRKDPLQIGLRYLKTYTMKRLELKQKARETGDRSAQTLQSGLKVLINSYYGYFGSEYNFNDIEAAERVTEIGRKILTCMIAAVEDLGLLVVEADTDGIIVACQDRDPQEVLQVISDAIPPVFKVELERQGAVVFVSEMKNYMVFEPNGDLIEVKGGNWRGRDKPAFQTEAIPEFMKRWITQGVEAALDYARKVWAEIQSGNGWRWVVRTRRVGRGDKTLMQAGFKVGEKATYAYKNYKRREIALKPDEGYDQKYYADEFSDLVKKVIAAIDPAQIAAWERMVKQEARPLIFAG
jgi:DNA polymerase elongation subunit (family B)